MRTSARKKIFEAKKKIGHVIERSSIKSVLPDLPAHFSLFRQSGASHSQYHLICLCDRASKSSAPSGQAVHTRGDDCTAVGSSAVCSARLGLICPPEAVPGCFRDLRTQRRGAEEKKRLEN